MIQPESGPQERAARIRAAVEEQHAALARTVAILVSNSHPGLPWPEVMEMATEILHEAVEEALKHAATFDPSRSAAAWVRGIAAKRLLNRRRADARGRRCVPATVLGDEAWAAAIAVRSAAPDDMAVAGRLDLQQALDRLSPGERHAIEMRYFQGLDGAALASALGVSTPGAARVRVCRALQSLRAHFPAANQEVAS